ncbi:MAG: glutamate ligase domain-containing protein, partial [Cetobacterium sp.]
CRFEIVNFNGRTLILDGAHNEAGMKTLCNTLKTGYKKQDIIAITSILKDKNSKEIIDLLEKNVNQIIFTSLAENKRGQSGFELYNASNKIEKDYRENILDAYELAIKYPGKIILLCGSFYLLSKFKEDVLRNER